MIQECINTFYSLNLTEWVVLTVLCFIFFVRLVFICFFFAKVSFSLIDTASEVIDEPVSLLFTLRNEEGNIRKNLPGIIEMLNGKAEFVVVDDFSEDGSLSALGLLKQRFPQLRFSSLSQETRYSVKLAQNIALKSARNNWVVLMPVSMESPGEDWYAMVRRQIGQSGKNLVIAYSSLKPAAGLLNKLYRIENFFQFRKSVGFISNRIPFVYSEEHVFFRKENYFELGGFAHKLREPYANMELIINQFIRKNSTVVVADKVSGIRKDMEVTKIEYLDLLTKSLKIEAHLPRWKQFFLRFEEISQLLLLPVLILSFFLVFELRPLIVLLASILLVFQMLIIKMLLNRLNERKIFISSLVYGLVMPYFKLFFRWHIAKKGRKNKWKKV